MRGGINRFRDEATPDQAVAALDCYLDEGALRRRDALRSFSHGPEYELPGGLVYIKSETTGAGDTSAEASGCTANGKWKLDETTSVYTDDSANAYNSTDIGSTVTRGSTDRFGNAAAAYINDDGSVDDNVSTGYIDTTDHDPTDGSGAFSVSLWTNIDYLFRQNVFLAKCKDLGAQPSDSSYLLFWMGTRGPGGVGANQQLRGYIHGTVWTTTSKFLSTGSWGMLHVTFTPSGTDTNVAVYWNGTLIETVVCAARLDDAALTGAGTHPWVIGAQYGRGYTGYGSKKSTDDHYHSLHGKIQDVQVYPCALSAGAITTHHAAQASGGSVTSWSDRTPDGTTAADYVYVGCLEQFDGVRWRGLPQPMPSPELYLRFDDADIDSSAGYNRLLDLMGNHHFVIPESGVTTGTTGSRGEAFTFDGATIMEADSEGLPLPRGPFSICVAGAVDSYAAEHTMLELGGHPSDAAYGLRVYVDTSGQIVAKGYDLDGNAVTCTWAGPVSVTKFDMVAVVFDGYYLRLYVSGSLVASTACGTQQMRFCQAGESGSSSISAGLTLGGYQRSGTTSYWDGEIDRVAYWPSYALDATQVARQNTSGLERALGWPLDTEVKAPYDLKLEYWDGSGWSAPTWHLDRTKGYRAVASAASSLVRDGTIAWHLSQLSDWGQTAVGGVTGYWVRLALVDSDDTVTSFYPECYEPGVGVFHLEPVTSIFPVHMANGHQMVVCSSREIARSVAEKGAQIGVIRNPREACEVLSLLSDEGAGVWDVQTYPNWVRASDGATVGTGSTRGTASRLTKDLTVLADGRNFDWFDGQHRGGSLIGDGSGSAPDFGPTFVSTQSLVAPAAIAPRDQYYEHCRLRVTGKGAGGSTVGAERAVHKSLKEGELYYEDAFTTDPDTDNVFELRGPPKRVRFEGEPRSFEVYDTDTADTIQFAEGRPFGPEVPSKWDGEPVYFYIQQEGRFELSGKRWSGVIDTVTRDLILMNEGRALRFDGSRLRQLLADSTSESAESFAGKIPDDVLPSVAERGLSLLDKEVPTGKYIVNFQHRLVVAGLPGRPYDVRYSAPGALNNIWPLVYETQVRDQEQDGIRGLATLRDRLVAFTPTAIHESDGPDGNGFLSFRPVAQGIGFTSHWAVAQAAIRGRLALVGPGPDGVWLWGGGEPVEALDEWSRVVPGGVNAGLLHNAVGAVLRQQSVYALAVTPRGGTENTRLLWWDYEARSWWLFSLPFGCSAITATTDARGVERLVLGTNDGFVCVLSDGETDDGETITGTAHGAWVQPQGGRAFNPTTLLLTAETDGAKTLTAKLYLQKDEISHQSLDHALNDGDTQWDSATWDTDSWGRRREIVMPQNVRGTRAEQASLEVSGTGRWRLRNAELIVRALSRRGRR